MAVSLSKNGARAGLYSRISVQQMHYYRDNFVISSSVQTHLLPESRRQFLTVAYGPGSNLILTETPLPPFFNHCLSRHKAGGERIGRNGVQLKVTHTLAQMGELETANSSSVIS